MIEVVDLLDARARYEAVDLSTRIGRPDISADQRERRALTYSLRPAHFALDEIDYRPDPGMPIFPGCLPAPVYGAFMAGRLVGALVCSCRLPELPTRASMIGVEPEYRRRGVGAALVRRAIADIGVLGVAPADDAAKAFFDALGFGRWQETACGATVGWAGDIDQPDLRFAVPAASLDELFEAHAIIHGSEVAA